jgi:hypothetical protein
MCVLLVDELGADNSGVARSKLNYGGHGFQCIYDRIRVFLFVSIFIIHLGTSTTNTVRVVCVCMSMRDRKLIILKLQKNIIERNTVVVYKFIHGRPILFLSSHHLLLFFLNSLSTSHGEKKRYSNF